METKTDISVEETMMRTVFKRGLHAPASRTEYNYDVDFIVVLMI